MMYPTKWISITNGFHEGYSLDFGWCSHKYQDIMACDDGVVLATEVQKSGGNCIYIRHNSGIVSLYAHLDTMIVKKNQVVKMGEKIGTMGATGGVYNKITKKYDPIAMHLHFGLYSKEKAALGFNSKGLHGNSDINPFKLLYVYPNQDATKVSKQFQGELRYFDDKQKWIAGYYEILVPKAVRKSHNLGLNVYKVKELKLWDDNEKKMLVSRNPNAEAKIDKGNVIQIVQIFDQNGRIWGKYGNYGSDWIVLCNINGKEQAKRV